MEPGIALGGGSEEVRLVFMVEERSMKELLEIILPNIIPEQIVCNELESWYFGDLQAVSLAYGEDFTSLAGKQKYRDPDKMRNVKAELRKLIPAYQPLSGAKSIAKYMDINNNTSRSFQVFVNGVRKVCQ